jgi:energy-coupling factor transport system permease protein
MTYRRLSSPLHAARAGAAGSWCLVLAAGEMTSDSPLLLATLGLTVLGAARLAGAGRLVVRAMLWALPLALLFALINPFVSRNGLTVLARLGELPPFGQIDLTLEALVYGLVFGLRVVVLLATFALFTAVIDPDELLRMFRRISPRSALTAVLATRMMPVLARDAQRLDDARRCRSDGGEKSGTGRLAVLRAVAGSSLERSLDAAATLDVRGYGVGIRRTGRHGQPWSRHDLGFAASAATLAGLLIVMKVAGLAGFSPYPTISIDVTATALAACAALVLAALAPFADRRGVQR